MAGFGDLFGKESVAGQFLMWNVGSVLTGALMSPLVNELTQLAYLSDPNVPLSPNAVAELVSRGLASEAWGKEEAQLTGVDQDRLNHLIDAVRHAPPLEAILSLYSRGLGDGGPGGITEGELNLALADLGVDPKWQAAAKLLAVQPPTAQEALNALLQGQITEEEAVSRWVQAGGDITWFQHAFDSEGSSPTPDMLGTMANRGIIPWEGGGPEVTSFHQGFLEGPWRNKWEAPMRRLAEYLPPPRTVTALQHAGVITNAQALALYEKEGLSPELAAAYVKSATEAKVVADKNLAKGDILALYKGKIITHAQALSLLGTLKYSTVDAGYILAVADLAQTTSNTRASVSRVHALYLGHKITKTAAVGVLHDLGISSSISAATIAQWDLEKSVNVRQLTPAQIETAWDKNIFTLAEALSELEHLGYTPYDAWVLMSIKNGKALAGKPAIDASGPGVLP